MMQRDRFECHRQFRAAELVLAMVTDDHVLDFRDQRLRERLAVARHRERNDLATVVLTPFVSTFGVVEVDEDDRVVAFDEKPTLPYWINAGIYVLSREAIAMMPEVGDHERTTFPELAAKRRLGAFKSTGYWRSVDTVKDLSEVRQELEQRLLSAFLA